MSDVDALKLAVLELTDKIKLLEEKVKVLTRDNGILMRTHTKGQTE